MTEIEDLAAEGWIIRRRWLPVLVLVLTLGAVCVGVTGIYAGSTLTEGRWENQKLQYEQRLGTQSAEYAKNLQTFQDDLEPIVRGLAQTQQDVHKLSEKFDKATAKRDRANAEAVRAAKSAADKADALSVQIARQQQTLVPKIEEAASAAKATEKKLDTAVHPPLPPQPWAGNRR